MQYDSFTTEEVLTVADGVFTSFAVRVSDRSHPVKCLIIKLCDNRVFHQLFYMLIFYVINQKHVFVFTGSADVYFLLMYRSVYDHRQFFTSRQTDLNSFYWWIFKHTFVTAVSVCSVYVHTVKFVSVLL